MITLCAFLRDPVLRFAIPWFAIYRSQHDSSHTFTKALFWSQFFNFLRQVPYLPYAARNLCVVAFGLVQLIGYPLVVLKWDRTKTYEHCKYG